MSDGVAERLVDEARADVEACAQLEFWIMQLRAAIQARQDLLNLPADQVKTALETRR